MGGSVVGGGWWVGVWPGAIYCQPQSLLVIDLIGTWLGLGQGGFWTKGLGMGLDNMPINCCPYPCPGIPPHPSFIAADWHSYKCHYDF
mgnify:CR=1 FL=1